MTLPKVSGPDEAFEPMEEGLSRQEPFWRAGASGTGPLFFIYAVACHEQGQGGSYGRTPQPAPPVSWSLRLFSLPGSMKHLRDGHVIIASAPALPAPSAISGSVEAV